MFKPRQKGIMMEDPNTPTPTVLTSLLKKPKPAVVKSTVGTQTGAPVGTTSTASSNALGTVQGAKPVAAPTYNPTFQPGPTTDMSRLWSAIGSRPAQQFGLGELRPLMDAQRGAGTLGPRTFGLDQLQRAIGSANQAGSPVDLPSQRFGSPDQMMALVNQLSQALGPQFQLQEQGAQEAFNQGLGRIREDWASRGLLASGGAAAQERTAVGDLARAVAQIRADQMGTAIPLALQFGQLGLSEDAQRFGQAADNRNFLAGRAQQNVGNLLGAYGAEEGSRQFQSQFDQAKAQQAVQNMLGALGFQENQQQNFISNTASATGMDMAQNQWANQFGLERQAQDFNRHMQTQQLNSQNMSNWLDQIVGASGQADAAGLARDQFGQQQSEFAEAVRQFNQQFGENSRMNDFGIAQAIAQMTGNFQGNRTLQGQEFDFNRSVAESGLTGKYGGQDTLQARELLANLFGFDPTTGQQTMDNKLSKIGTAMQLMQMFPNVPGGLEAFLGGNGQFSDLGGILGSLTGQQTLPAWQTSQEIGLRRDLSGAERSDRAATEAKQLEMLQKLRGVAPAVIGFMENGDLAAAMDLLITNGIDPGDFFKAAGVGMEAFPGSAEPTPEALQFANQFGTDPMTGDIISQLSTSGITDRNALLTMISRMRQDPSMKGTDWNSVNKWINQTYPAQRGPSLLDALLGRGQSSGGMGGGNVTDEALASALFGMSGSTGSPWSGVPWNAGQDYGTPAQAVPFTRDWINRVRRGFYGPNTRLLEK